jgi:ABC-type branched-subunit amino acid transport system permease subunit
VELLFVALGGVLLGLAARYLLPGRSTQGSILVPAIGTAVACVVWVALTWLGWRWDGGWIWWVSLGLAAVVSFGAELLLWRRRTQGDKRMLHELTKTGAPRSA